MRFLKTKILRAQEALDKKLASDSTPETDVSKSPAQQTFDVKSEASGAEAASPGTLIAKNLSERRQKQDFAHKRQSHKRSPNGSSRATKNIVINFGKAIASFAGSPLALPYLGAMLEKEEVTNKEFEDFVIQAKAGIGGIDSFRLLLIILEGDAPKLAACKRVFAEIAKVFIKYFSVNWIIHGRVTHKMTHLKYRYKVLRRIENPQLFTYISEGKRRSGY